MEIKEDELKVFYRGKINSELDKAIENSLKNFGYKLRNFGVDAMNIYLVRELFFILHSN